jgi:hypothetical protein
MNWRREFENEFSDKFSWLVQNDKKTILIGLIKVVNAVWFAGLWQAGWVIGAPLFFWLGFFVITMLIAIRLDFYKEEKNG